MQKISTIQKRNTLNAVCRADEPGPGGACHEYVVCHASTVNGEPVPIETITFQNGARKDPEATTGVLDCDLLEIVRDRLKAFQQGEFSTRENALALTHIEEALMWMNRRVEDRAERQVLGTMQK